MPYQYLVLPYHLLSISYVKITSQGFTVIDLIWNVAPGNSDVSAATVALIPILDSAPRMMPQGNQRNCRFVSFTIVHFPAHYARLRRNIIPAPRAPRPVPQPRYSSWRMGEMSCRSARRRRGGWSSGYRSACGRRASRGLCKGILWRRGCL